MLQVARAPLKCLGSREVYCALLGCMGEGLRWSHPGEAPVSGPESCRCRATEISVTQETCPLELSFPGEWNLKVNSLSCLQAPHPESAGNVYSNHWAQRTNLQVLKPEVVEQESVLLLLSLEPLLLKEDCFYWRNESVWRGPGQWLM